jgi:hypothetical protein
MKCCHAPSTSGIDSLLFVNQLFTTNIQSTVLLCLYALLITTISRSCQLNFKFSLSDKLENGGEQ